MGRVIGIQSNIAEKLFTNETPLSGNVPLLHQEGRAWARMQNVDIGHWTLDRTLTLTETRLTVNRDTLWNFEGYKF